MTDPLAEAIARAAAKNDPTPMAEIGINLPTGRHAQLRVPDDITLQEAAAMAMHVGTFIHQALQMAEARRQNATAAASGLAVPGIRQ